MTKVLLYLTHLQLTEVDNQYFIFFIEVGNFISEKKHLMIFHKLCFKNRFSKVPNFLILMEHNQFKRYEKMRTFLKFNLRGLC